MRLFAVAAIVLLSLTCAAAQPASTDCTETKAQLKRAETKLSDWPALARYRDDNSKMKLPERTEKRVVFIGDSITDSWDDPKYGGFFPGRPYINRGISGQTTPQMLLRFRADVIACVRRSW